MSLYQISVVIGKRRIVVFIQAKSLAQAMAFAKFVYANCESRSVRKVQSPLARTLWA